jgi:transposase
VVVDVPAEPRSRACLIATGNARKNDRVDAFRAAPAALGGERRLADVGEEGHSEIPRMLPERREDLIEERTRTPNRLHGSLGDLLAGGAPKNLSAEGAARVPRGVRPRGGPARTRRRSASDLLLRDARRIDRRLREPERRIREAAEEAPTGSTRMFGVGPDPGGEDRREGGQRSRRFPTEAHFASYTGTTAPIEASSGEEVVRHRLSRAGDRKLDHAPRPIAICQARHDTEGGAYYRRKLAEGKSEKGALRCLKRRIPDAVYEQPRADLGVAAGNAAA